MLRLALPLAPRPAASGSARLTTVDLWLLTVVLAWGVGGVVNKYLARSVCAEPGATPPAAA